MRISIRILIIVFLVSASFAAEAILRMPACVWAFFCGPQTLTINVGETGTYTIKGDGSTVGNFEVTSGGGGIASVSPPAVSSATEATFTFTGLQAGSTTFTISWSAYNGEYKGQCPVTVIVVSQESQPPAAPPGPTEQPEPPPTPKKPKHSWINSVPKIPGYEAPGPLTTPKGGGAGEGPSPMVPKGLMGRIRAFGRPEVPETPKAPSETPKTSPRSPVSVKEDCCCFKSILFRNTTNFPVKFSLSGPAQPTEVGPGNTFTVSEYSACITLSFWYPDPERNWGFAGQKTFCCKDLKPGPVKDFPGLEVVAIEKVPCPPEKCSEAPGEGVPTPTVPKKPTTPEKERTDPKKPTPEEPTTPKKPERPEEPTPTGGGEGETPPTRPKTVPKTDKPIPDGGGRPTPEEGEPPPEEDTTCDCEFLDKHWVPFQTIDAAYVYIPPPRRDVKIPLRGKVELKAQGADQDILVVRSIRTVNGEKDCIGSQNVYAPDSVKYDWRIIEGEGKFKNGQRQDDGEAVIYIPPPDLAIGEHRVIIGTFVDDIEGKADDDINDGRIEMNIKRREREPDYYYIDFEVVDFKPVRVIKEPLIEDCECHITTYWAEGGMIEHEIIKPPDGYAICCDDRDVWVAHGGDFDDLFVNCDDERCGSDVKKFPISDVLTHSWYAKYGDYLDGNTGRKVLYKAPHGVPPEPPPQERIILRTEDSRQQYPDKEPEKKEKRITIVSLDLDINIDDKPKDANGIPIVSRPADIIDADEEKEEKLGGYIWPNDDNDHNAANDAVIDRDDRNYPGENDLEPILYNISEGVWEAGLSVEIEVTAIQGDIGNIKVWEENNKEHEIVLAGGKAVFNRKEELDADTDNLLYIEGIDRGIFKITMRIKNGEEIVCEDIIKVTVFSPVHMDWEPEGDTAVTRDSPAPPPGQSRDGKRIFPDRRAPADAAAHDRPKLTVRLEPDIPQDSGWRLPLYIKVFDVDHYHNNVNFDPNGQYQPEDNRTGYTSSAEGGDAYDIGIEVDNATVEHVIREDTTELRWSERVEGNPTPQEDAILHLTHSTPCNNWRVAAGSGDTMHDAVRINNDAADPGNGVTLEYINDRPLNISVISGPGNTTSQSAETLTVWRKIYIEQDHMEAVNFSEGPEELRSVRAGEVIATGAASVSVRLEFGRQNQFQGGQADFYRRSMLLFIPLGPPVGITGNTAGAGPNTVNLAAAPPPAARYVTISDDDVIPGVGMVGRLPHIQPQVPPVNLFNDAEGFPAACIEADFDTLNGFDTNNVTFELNMDSEFLTVSGGSKGTYGGNLFWVATSIGAYQYGSNDSSDPNWPASGSMWGISTPYWLGGGLAAASVGGGITFYETIRDWTTYIPVGAADTLETRLQRVTLHEVGHLLGGRHGEGGLMEAGNAGTGPGGGMFAPSTLRRFMLLHDEGPGHQ